MGGWPALGWAEIMETVDFRALFENSPNPYMVLDAGLHYVAANEAYLAATGTHFDQLRGKHVFVAFPHDPHDPANDNTRQLLASFEKVLRTGRTDVLARIVYRVPRADLADDSERVWSATHTPILGDDGKVAFILQHTVEVTEVERMRRLDGPVGATATQLEAGVYGRALAVQAENTTLASELRNLRLLLEQAPGFACALKGPEHVFELANRAYQSLVGHRELVGMRLIDALPEVRGQGIVELLDQVYRTGVPFVAAGREVMIQRTPESDTEARVLDFVYQPIVDDAGSTVGIFVQGNDITVQRRLMEELQRLAAIVEQSGDFIAARTCAPST